MDLGININGNDFGPAGASYNVSALKDQIIHFAIDYSSAGILPEATAGGPDISLNFLTLDAQGTPSPALRTLFAQEMIRGGVLMPWIAVSQSHGDAELALTLQAADAAMGVVRRALDGRIEDFLVGPAVKPVFRSHN